MTNRNFDKNCQGRRSYCNRTNIRKFPNIRNVNTIKNVSTLSKITMDELEIILKNEIEKYYDPNRTHRDLKQIWEQNFKGVMVYSTLRDKAIELFPDDYNLVWGRGLSEEVKKRIIEIIKEEIRKYDAPKETQRSLKQIWEQDLKYLIKYLRLCKFVKKTFPKKSPIIWSSETISDEVKNKIREIIKKEINKFYDPNQTHRSLLRIWENEFKGKVSRGNFNKIAKSLFPKEYEAIWHKNQESIKPSMKKKIIDVIGKEIKKFYDPNQKHRNLEQIRREDFNNIISDVYLEEFVRDQFPKDYDIIWSRKRVPYEVKQRIANIIPKEIEKCFSPSQKHRSMAQIYRQEFREVINPRYVDDFARKSFPEEYKIVWGNKNWDEFDWSLSGVPRTYDQAVRNAADYLLKNILTNKYKVKYGIKNGYAPSSPLLQKTHSEFTSAITHRKISYIDVRTKANLRKSPIYPDKYFREVPMVSNLHKVNNFPYLLRHLEFVKKNMTFPDYIIDNYDNFPRISKFGKTIGAITNITPKIAKYNFIKSLINTKKIDVVFPKNCKNHKSICNLLELSNYGVVKEHYGQEAFINPITRKPFAHGNAGHDYILSLQMEKDNNSVGAEVPIWENHGNMSLTGHIDLIKVIDSTKVLVIDYKPEQTPFLSMDALYSSFINSIPQVAFYGLVSKRIFNIDNIICITFNKNGAWIYEPRTLLNAIRNFLIKHSKPCQWEIYL